MFTKMNSLIQDIEYKTEPRFSLKDVINILYKNNQNLDRGSRYD